MLSRCKTHVSERERAVPLQCGFEAVRDQSSACHWLIQRESQGDRERESGGTQLSGIKTVQGKAVCV